MPRLVTRSGAGTRQPFVRHPRQRLATHPRLVPSRRPHLASRVQRARPGPSTASSCRPFVTRSRHAHRSPPVPPLLFTTPTPPQLAIPPQHPRLQHNTEPSQLESILRDRMLSICAIMRVACSFNPIGAEMLRYAPDRSFPASIAGKDLHTLNFAERIDPDQRDAKFGDDVSRAAMRDE
jgi:hypothetical protein